MDLKFDFAPFRPGTVIRLEEGKPSRCYAILCCEVREAGMQPHNLVTYIELELQQVVDQCYRWKIAPLYFRGSFQIESLWYKLLSTTVVALPHSDLCSIETIKLQREYWRDEVEAQ